MQFKIVNHHLIFFFNQVHILKLNMKNENIYEKVQNIINYIQGASEMSFIR